MFHRLMSTVIVFLLCVLLAGMSAIADQPFLVYTHSQRYRDALSEVGVESHPVKLVTKYGFYRRKSNEYDLSEVDEDVTRLVAKAYQGKGPVVLDIEEFNFKKDWRKATSQFETVIGIWREEQPHIRLGVYAMLPDFNYWEPVRFSQFLPGTYATRARSLIDWRRRNAMHSRDQTGGRDADHGIADLVDFVNPNLYAHYDRVWEWDRFAFHNLMEARQYNKPVIPWISGQYQSQNKLNDYLGDKYVRRQIELCKSMECEGVILFDRGPKFPAVPDSFFETVAKAVGE